MTDVPSDTAQPTEQPAGQADELERLRLGWQRCQADFENYRKRTERERADVWQLATTDTLLRVAPIADTFRHALSQHSDSAAWRTGVEQISKQLDELLRANHLERLEVVGQPFDPMQHEAVSQLPHDTVPADHVVHEVESGYRYRDTILKPAKVVVSTGPQPAA